MNLEGILGGILGLIGIFISLYYSQRLNKQNQKFQLDMERTRNEQENWRNKYKMLVQLISYRNDVQSMQYTSALNGAVAVFYDSKEVIDAIKELYHYLEIGDVTKAIANEKMVDLYYKMYKHLGIEEHVDKVFLNKVFNGK